MQLIYDIVKKLKKQEIRQIKHQIKHAPFEFEKLGKLFDLVTRYEEKEESFYSQKLYKKPPDNTFRVTKSRLKRMLENAILHDKSLTGYTPGINARLQARKKLLQGEILLGRGAYLASKNLLQQVIATARKFDLYEEYFQAEMLLYRNQSIRTSVKEYKKQTANLLEINRLKASINEAMILYYSISNLLINKALKPGQKTEVRATIDQLQILCESTGHPQVQNLYYLSEIYYQQIDKQDQHALDFCHKYLSLVQEDKSLSSPQRLAVAFGHLAQVYMRLKQTDEARRYANEALQIFSPDEMNYLQGLELSYIIDFFAGDFEAAMQQVQTAMEHPEISVSKMTSARWHYFRACVLFQKRQFQDSYMALNDTTPLLADKYGMNISIRLLEIMILFELQHLDLMETKILNMRQFIKRTHKNQQLSRPDYLVRLLIRWYRLNYNFAQTLEEFSQDIREQQAAMDPQGAIGPGFELIRLEDWMEQKREISE